MGNLVNNAKNAKQAWKSANEPSTPGDWEALNQNQLSNYLKLERKYDAEIEDAQAKEDSFFAARNTAFSNFENQKLNDFNTLKNLWQAKEEHNYDINYTP